jgi:hypothetical protein
MIGVLMALAIIVTALVYIVHRTTTSIATGPSTTTGASAPSSTAQGGGVGRRETAR